MESQFIIIQEGLPSVVDSHRLIDAIDMNDCLHVDAVYRVPEIRGVPDGSAPLEKLRVYGPWHSDDVLYIAVKDAAGNVVAEGWGTDH